ncbi:VpsP family polysaccharide biosynthesis protein [Amphritea sp. HPY]|uniref:VpsP family polysaccharide biosynthesis protein n=1 Tax=Amphritea sp. HPY TaxID=3421652 RepID=UPI003D7D55B6
MSIKFISKKCNKRKLSAFVLMLSLLGIIVFPVRWAIGDIYTYPVRYAVKDWHQQSSLPAQVELDRAMDNINKALWWDPENPEYTDYQGFLYYYQGLVSISDQQADFTPHFRQALASFKTSTRTRPMWPYSWAYIALMKAYLAEFDQEYRSAIHQASKLGPWENSVNIALTEAGLIGWSHNNPALTQVVVDNIARGLRRNNKEIRQIIQAHNKTALVCAYMQADLTRQGMCGF